MKRLALRLLPAALLVAAVAGLAGLAWRVVHAERLLAERAAREALRGRAREAATRIAELAARLTAEAASGKRAAVLGSDGRFVRPAEGIAVRRLTLVPGRDPEGRFYLDLAAEAETVDGVVSRAEEAYALAASEERDPETRRLALYRFHAFLRRQGRVEEAGIARRAFLRMLDDETRLTAEALVLRGLGPDAELRVDLLRCLGGGDDVIVEGLLAGLPDDDPAARARRDEELARLGRLRGLLPAESLRGSGVRLAGDWLLAWTEMPAGEVRLAEAPAPDLGAGVRSLDGGAAIPAADTLVEVIPLGDLLPGVRVAARGSRADAEAEARRRTTIVVGALLLLLLGGGGVLILALRAVRREAETARLRAEFLARVGHDLRTPLARMRLYAETMASGKVSRAEDVREFAAVVQRDSERLSALVRTVLDLTRLDGTLRTEVLDLGSLLAETADAHRPLLDEAGMALHLGTRTDPVSVEGDADALRGAIGNLIENAWRHAAAGGHLDLALVVREGAVDVSVADRGPGLPDGLEERIFERFVRGPDAGRMGAGLGLALVAEVAEAHGGDVRAENRPGGGARFVLRIPRREETA